MRGLLATVALLLVIAGIVCYANGWLVFHRGPDSTTIEVKTRQIDRAADEAIEETMQESKEFIDRATNTQSADADKERPVVVDSNRVPLEPVDPTPVEKIAP
jgi:hypothetical protein